MRDDVMIIIMSVSCRDEIMHDDILYSSALGCGYFQPVYGLGCGYSQQNLL